MFCEDDHMPILDVEHIEALSVDGWRTSYDTAAGFCVKAKALVKHEVRAGRSGHLDVPVIEQGSPYHIHVWFTAEAPLLGLKSIAVLPAWAKLLNLDTKLEEVYTWERYGINFGPAKAGTRYRIECQALDYIDTVIHIRLGGSRESN